LFNDRITERGVCEKINYTEGVNMVGVKESSGRLEELDATVEKVEFKKGAFGGQYELTLKAHNVEVKGKTGHFFEWIPLSKTATQEEVPKDSVAEKYLMQLEILLPAAKKAKTLDEVFKLLVGKRFIFKRVKLGRAFEGNPAKEYFFPVRQV
jgi:hypothetical protein